MNDMSKVIEPRSDQLNSDDLLVGPRTITIRDVTIRPGTEQPVSVFYEGDNNKPYKCCKSMARVLVHAWGADAKNYIGRSMTIYCDPKVKWGGMQVGGIRISHMSHIDRELQMALTETKGRKAPFIVKPLRESARKADAPGAEGARASGSQAATQAPPPVDTSIPPAMISVPQLDDKSGSDWRAWLQSIGAAIDAAPDVAWLDKLTEANLAPAGSLKLASEKQHAKLIEKIAERRNVLAGDQKPLI